MPHSSNKPRIAALILAAGNGSRFDATTPKQYTKLGNKSILEQAIIAFSSCKNLTTILPIIAQNSPLEESLTTYCYGGNNCQSSTLNGLTHLVKKYNFTDNDIVLIHDGARPFLTQNLIQNCIKTTIKHGNAIPVLPVTDTLRHQNNGQTKTIPRQNLHHIQTPQAFKFGQIYTAHQKYKGKNLGDDAALLEADNQKLHFITGEKNNIKITHKSDLEQAQMIFNHQHPLYPHIGQGYDVHAFCKGNHVTLCGLKIPHTHALKGHSDADVALHALTDAILGALAEGDIGTHFPPSDQQWKNANSAQFLTYALNRVKKRQGKTQHLDLTLICEAPKIGKYRQEMQKNLAKITKLPLSSLSIKATTSEKLGFTGRREGIATTATATLLLPPTPET